MENLKGKIVAVYGAVVDVQFEGESQPHMFEIIIAKGLKGEDIILEVEEHRQAKVCRCIALTSTFGLKRNSFCSATGKMLFVPGGEELYGRVINVLGKPIDNGPPLKDLDLIPIRNYKDEMEERVQFKTDEEVNVEVLETGIKAIDLLFPLAKGSKTGILGGAALGKTILILEIIHNITVIQRGTCIFAGIGERIREGNEFYHELEKRNLLQRSILIFGQMNEVPGARFEVAQVGVSIAEAFLERGDDVLFFVDNVFRFAQAGSELSALLGRIPSETGYQPTLSTEISAFHERIRSKNQKAITAIEAVYVPSDDLTDPAVVSIFSHLDSILVLSRDYVQQGLYPAIDSLQSSGGVMDPEIVGKEHFEVAQEVIRFLQKYQDLQRIVAIIGKEELSQQERVMFDRAKKLRNFLTQPFFTAELYTGKQGVFVSLEETIKGCQKIIAGDVDSLPEDKLYLIGALELE